MITLNITASSAEETILKEYLENNVSDILADKINNGVRIEKDGKVLINKKDLTGFLKYACDEAKKLAEKGATSACIKDETVFGWAIHYFEEDSIEGALYNEDGTEYKTKPVVNKSAEKAPVINTVNKVKPSTSGQPKTAAKSLFDLMDEVDAETEPKEDNADDCDGEDAEFDEIETLTNGVPDGEAAEVVPNVEPQTQGKPIQQLYQISPTQYMNEGGEILDIKDVPVDNTVNAIAGIFGDKMEVKL